MLSRLASLSPQLEIPILLATIVVTFALFLWGRWRYDLVSLAVLLFLTVLGIVPRQEAFLGFGHPAVVTVVAVLILSSGLQNSGLLDHLSQCLAKLKSGRTLRLLILCGTTAFLSAFINNIGALAVMMPVALQAAREQKDSPSLYLMPIAFSSLLGGLTTMIGTPPNIIIAGYRASALSGEFQLFDFAFVGLPLALLGVLFLSLAAVYLLPQRRTAEEAADKFDVGDYTTELVVPDASSFVGKDFAELEKLADEEIILLVAASKKGQREGLSKRRKLKKGDSLVIEGPPEAIKKLLQRTDLEIKANKELEEEVASTEAHLVSEAVVLPESSLVGRMPRAKTLRQRFSVALLAVARQGKSLRKRFSQIQLSVGDVLLLRGEQEDIDEMIRETRCSPLLPREIRIGLSSRSFLAVAIFLSVIALVFFRVLPAEIAFPLGAVGMVLIGLVPIAAVYRQIDWSIVILLGALLPVGQALENTGAAQAIVQSLMKYTSSWGPEWLLAILFITVMFLSDLINNAAAAALAAPLAMKMAAELGVSADPFLMAVAIGASCAFLTPIGHQSNTLVMGPGGYRFTDYSRLGLPLEILIVAVSLPALLYFWPLSGSVS